MNKGREPLHQSLCEIQIARVYSLNQVQDQDELLITRVKSLDQDELLITRVKSLDQAQDQISTTRVKSLLLLDIPWRAKSFLLGVGRRTN